jgi:hypothetical protein
MVRPVRIAQTQGADAAEIIDRQQVVHLGECGQPRIILAALGVVAGDDAPAPGVRYRIGDRAMKDRIMRRGGLVGLVSQHQLQVGRDVEARRVRQPGLVVDNRAVLAPALPDIHERANRHARLADAKLDLTADRRDRGLHSAPGVRDLLRTRLGSCSSISVRPMSSFEVSSKRSKAWISPKTCNARPKK